MFMFIRRLATAALTVGMCGLACAPMASAQGLELRYQLTSHQPGTPTGATLHVVYPDTGPGGKPKPVSKGVYEFPSGTVINERAVPVCSASDAQFQIEGYEACSADTSLGGGGITVDTGLGRPFDPFPLDDRYFHGPGQLITVFTAHGTPTPVLQVNRLKIQGSTIIDLPSLPPGYPPGTKTVAKQVDQEIAPVITAAGAFMTTPPTCPPSHVWIARLTITYDDGTIDTAASQTPCSPPGAARAAGAPSRPARAHRSKHRHQWRR